jgi:ABC-type branched-subunit amino acid transport system permease subunit
MRLSVTNRVAVAALALFALLPLVAGSGLTADLAIYFAYALFAVSLAFVWGQAGLLSLGHGVFFGVGAYGMSIVTLGMVPGLPELHSTWVGLAVAVAASGLAAAVTGVLCFAGRGLKGAFFGIVTLAIAFIAERLATSSTWLGGLNGLMNVPPVILGWNGEGRAIFDALPLYYISLGVLAAAMAGLSWLLAGRFGILLAAIRDNELRIWSLGADVRRIKIQAYALSGAVAGLAGALFVTQFGFAAPSLVGFSLSLDVLIWVAIGGRNSLIAAALGAITVRLLESRLADLIGPVWPLVLGLLFMASVIFFPKGLFGGLIAVLGRPKRQPLP